MEYGKVYHRFWKSRTVRAWDDSARTLALYLLTSQHSTSEGYYHLPIAYVAADLGWPMTKVEKAFAQLDADDFARYDPDAEVVLVVKAIQWNPPSGVPQIKGALNKIMEAPACPLLGELLASAQGLPEGLIEGLIPLADPFEGVSGQDLDPLESSSSNSSSSSSSKGTSSSTAVDTDDTLRGFDEFWSVWPARDGKKINRGKAEDQWRKLSLDKRRLAYIGAGHYAAASRAGSQGAMDAFRWLRDGLWVDWQEPGAPGGGRDRPMTLMADGQEIAL